MEQDRNESSNNMDWEPSENEAGNDGSEEFFSESEEEENSDDASDSVDYRSHEEVELDRLLKLENNKFGESYGDEFELTSTDEDYLKRFGSAIAKSSEVYGITFNWKKDDEISSDSIEAIRKGLAENYSIREIFFVGGIFSKGEIFHALGRAFEISPADRDTSGSSTEYKLETLVLSNIKINDEAMKKLSVALSEHLAVKHLLLGYEEFKRGNGWKLLCNSFQSLHMNLKELDLMDHKNSLENSGFIEFSGGLAQNTSLRKLTVNFRRNSLVTDVGWAAFGYALSKSHVEDLTLWNNDLDHDKMSALASGLLKSQKLTTLCIGRGSLISGGGIRELADVIANPLSKLKYLSFLHCDLNDDDFVILSSGLKSNNTLKSLLFRFWSVHEKVSALNRFAQDVLCNTSSINCTYYSNHTLEEIEVDCDGVRKMPMPQDVEHCLELNRNRDKEFVAVKKVFDCYLHGNFQLRPFQNMGFKLLVNVLGWVGTRSKYNDAIDGVTRLAAFYRLLKSDPALFKVPE